MQQGFVRLEHFSQFFTYLDLGQLQKLHIFLVKRFWILRANWLVGGATLRTINCIMLKRFGNHLGTKGIERSIQNLQTFIIR